MWLWEENTSRVTTLILLLHKRTSKTLTLIEQIFSSHRTSFRSLCVSDLCVTPQRSAKCMEFDQLTLHWDMFVYIVVF